MNTQEPNAWVVSSKSKGRKKIYKDNKVFLTEGEEFEIELYNPTNQTIIALLNLNDKAIINPSLFIKPNKRIYIDSFNDSVNKLIFSPGENTDISTLSIVFHTETESIANPVSCIYTLVSDTQRPKTSKDVLGNISNKLSQSDSINDHISNLLTFGDLKYCNAIDNYEYEVIKEKLVEKLMKLSTNPICIHDLSSTLLTTFDLIGQDVITVEQFDTIKSNLFSSIK